MYGPQLGRFISRDPIGYDAGDVNLYQYVGGNPINYSDPQGTVGGYVPPGGGRNFRPPSHVGTVTDVEWNAALGKGIDQVICCDANHHTRTMIFEKVCYGPGLGVGMSGGITNMAGITCDPNNYKGWFIELAGSIGVVGGGMGIGVDQGGLTGTNVGSAGFGVGYYKLMACKYTLISDNEDDDCCR